MIGHIERSLKAWSWSAPRTRILWVFGLYEIVRVVKETNPSKFEALEELFRKLEILRMPLSKHEVKRTAKYRNTPHYPTGFWFAESGAVGWRVFNPRAEAVQPFTRTGIANEFLSITATEPIFQVAIDTTPVEPPPERKTVRAMKGIR